MQKEKVGLLYQMIAAQGIERIRLKKGYWRK